MKDKILSALKTKYSNLGFGEKAFSGVADYLISTITEEAQIETAISGVENLLKAFQGDIDRVRTEKSDLQKQYEELKAKQGEGGTPVKKDEPKPDDLKSMIAAAVAEAVMPFQQKLQSYEQKEVQTARQTFISEEAKRLGIDAEDLEFLKIPDELDNTGITDRLTTYQQRQINRSLPRRTPFTQVAEDQCAKDEEKEYVASLPDAETI